MIGHAKVHFLDECKRPIVLEGQTATGTMGTEAYVEVIVHLEDKTAELAKTYAEIKIKVVVLPLRAVTYIEFDEKVERLR